MKTTKPLLSGANGVLHCRKIPALPSNMPTLRLISGLLPILASLPSFLLAAPETQADRAEPDLKTFVRGKVADFHERRIQRLSTLQLDRVLARKNPYLLKAKSLDTPRKLVTELLDSHLTPQEAGIFGSVMEQLALEVCRRNYGGRKSAVEGIDMEFERGGSHYLVSIKSGPNWGNSSQIAKMRDYFRKAKKTLGTNTSKAAKVIAVNGCCYGSTPSEDRGDYLKLCGKNFWTLISGDDQLYQKLIPLIGDESGGRNSRFDLEYEKALARLTTEFREKYCNQRGDILWEKVTELSSGDQ